MGAARVVVAAPLQPLLQAASPVTKLALTCGNNQVSVQVTVYVEDVNDHAPSFAVKNITVTVDELTPVGLTILPEIRVTDGDKANTANSEVTLELRDGDPEGHFTMADRKRGTITLSKHLDYDAGPEIFLLGVVAKDAGSPSLSSTTTVTVVVVDADDLPPVFSHERYFAKVSEHPGHDTGATIREEVSVGPGPLRALDGDVGQNASLRYTLVRSPASEYFTLDPSTAQLFLTKHLDREALTDSTLVLHVRAEQEDNPRRVGSSVIEVFVEDVNDNLPEFSHSVYAISIVENLPSGFSVVQVSATDRDEGVNGAFNYHVVGGQGALTVNPLSGWLTVDNHNILDREESPVITLYVCANQIAPVIQAPPGLRQTSLFRNRTSGGADGSPRRGVVDAKEGKEKKEEEEEEEEEGVTPEATVTEELPATLRERPGDSPTRVTVPLLRRRTRPTPSARAGERIRSSPSAESRAPSDIVTRQRRTDGQRRGKAAEERSGGPSRNEEDDFDATTTPPPSPSASTTTPAGEDSSPRSRLQRVRSNLSKRRLLSPRRLRRRIDEIQSRSSRRSRPRSKRSGAEAKDSPDSPDFSSDSESCAKIELKLLDANDNNPEFLPSNQYHFTITEEAGEGDVVGSVQAEDRDEGGNGRVMYSIQSPGNTTKRDRTKAFSIDETRGTIRLVTKLLPGEVTLFVEASDTPSNPSETRTSLAVVTVYVQATQMWEPRFVGAPYELWVGSDATVGTSVGQVRVVDMEGSELMFDMFHSYQEGVPFAIEESSGIVSVVAPVEQFERTNYEFEAVVTDGRTSLVTNVTIHVAPDRRPSTRRSTVVSFSVQENVAGGLVGDLVTALRDVGARIASDPQFELVSPEARKHFALGQDASLYTVAPLDYETSPNHTLVIVSGRTSDIYYVNVQVEDLNDNPPQLNAVAYEGTIRENALPGTTIRVLPAIQVSDKDQYPGATYFLQLFGDAAHLFDIDSSSGQVTFVGDSLDREQVDSYVLRVEARDDGNLTSRANLTINIEDVNDNPPRFVDREPLFSAREDDLDENSSRKLPDASALESLADLERSLVKIPESLPIGSRVTEVTATDADEKLYADVRYRIDAQTSFSFAGGESTTPILEEASTFSIESKTGVVVVAGPLEPDHFYLLNVSATDGGGLSSHTTVSIAVFDVNDHTPRFERPVYNFEVVEGEYLVGEVGKVVAFDQDLGNNAKVHYQIIFYKNSSEDQVFPFRIVETSGTILATGTVNREEREVYEFSVVATDMGTPQLSSSVLVHIDVIDVNDHRPEFYDYKDAIYPGEASADGQLESGNGNFTPVYTAVVSEHAPRGTVVARVYANDSDSNTSGNGLILYKLEGGEDKFSIDSNNGSVYTVGSLDYERSPTHNLTVVAQDLGSPPLSASALLVVTVVDVEEELTTRLFDREEYEVRVMENNDTPLRLLDLNVSEAFSGQQLYFQLVDPGMSGTVAVDSYSGEIYLIASLDRETRSDYRFKVRAAQPERGRALEYLNEQSQNTERFDETATTEDDAPLPTATDTQLPIVVALETLPRNGAGEMSVPAEVVSLGTYRRPARRQRSAGPLVEPLEDPQPLHIQTSMLVGGSSEDDLGLDEVWVTVVVEDQNDNSPSILPQGRPVVAAVPATAAYGHFVTKIMARDPDQGKNGELRYEILPGEGAQDASTRFAVDPASGQVVVIGSLEDESGKMFGFDVRVSDLRGAPSARSAIANVFVHVLGAGGHLVLEVAARPREVEPHLFHIQGMLTNVSGLDVRVQRIAPHVDGDAALTTALTAELAILIGAVVVFLVTVTTIVCLCYKQRKSRRKPMPMPPMMTAAGIPVMPLAYPGPFAAPYTHMSDHSSSDSTEAQEIPHDHPHYPHDLVHYPPDPASYPADPALTTHFPQDPNHYPRPPPRRRSCAHSFQADRELLHPCSSGERVSSHTDEDEGSGPVCLRHAPSRKRRRGTQQGTEGRGAGPSHKSRSSSRAGRRALGEEPSSSDFDERDHAPPLVTIPRPQPCCMEDRQRSNAHNPRTLPTVDCTLENPGRPHSPDSLERPSHCRAGAHTHTIPRTHLKRERGSDHVGRNADLHPSDVTEL
ncbi:cadherin-89D-like [Penaeus japonicus]|uniref:cadherin-89D-like n=1 Tax=Penaeus japonicus TaxID=27405 RepID=UPI001C70B232|nr:cadherin-89D-like [Penaeus japonicus]